jgi:YD repeat-containing protein
MSGPFTTIGPLSARCAVAAQRRSSCQSLERRQSSGRRGLPIEVKLGALQTGPALPGSVLSQDRLVAELEYDRGASGGNGYLTRLDQYVDDSEVRTTLFGYDWRGDQTSMKRPSENEEVLQEHDLQGQLVERRDVQRGYVVGSLHDVRGRTYRVVQQFRRTKKGDFVGWVDNIWRDAAGNVLAHESNAGRAFTKFTYDGLGQVTAEYLGTPAARMTEYGQGGRVAEDILFEQREYRYNEAGNLVWTTRRRRSPAAVARGPLQDEQSDPQARVDYSAMWYDPLGRLRAQADLGANGQTSMDRPLVIPQRSDAVLLTDLVFNARGELEHTMDPAGRIDSSRYDDAGREIVSTENVGGSPEETRHTKFTYSPDGEIQTITASNRATGDQVTKYEYGGMLDGVPLSILLKSVIDPLNRATTVSYNRQGERIRLGDPNGTTHHYRYDLLGRLDADRVDPGPGVAADTTEITYEYTESGLLEFVRSFGSRGNRRRALNRVRRTYNQFGQLTSEIQLHSEAEFEQNLQVHISYGYEVGAVDAGSVQHAPRRTTLAYPHGGPLDKHARFAIVYGHNDEFSSEAINRVASVGQGILKPVDDPVLSGAEARATTVLARYTPFGAGDVYRVTYPPTGDVLVRGNPLAFDVNGGFLPRIAATGEYDRSRDTSYRALDPFDRILELNWGQREYGFPERLSYWRSRLGHPLARRSRATVPWSMTERNVPLSQAHDERYQYDELDRLREMERGTLPGNYTRDARTAALSATNFEQSWRLDQQDNWTRFAEDSDGDGLSELVQRRQHDLSNRIEQVMPSGENAQPRYDRNGNMTRVPQMPGMGQPLDCQYDGWNRLVRICRDGADDRGI